MWAFQMVFQLRIGVTSVEVAKCSRNPSTAEQIKNVFWVKEPIFQKTRIITHEVANMLRIAFPSHQIILTDNLNMSHFRETCVPCTEWETDEESHQHMPCPLAVALQRPRTPSEDNHRWWNVDLQVWPSTPTQVRSNIKACLLFLFTFMELCTYECVSQGQTLNQHYYTDTLLHLWENVKWKWHDYMEYRILVLKL